jgi:16S rRNA (guanine527-N7)-methyltransferase
VNSLSDAQVESAVKPYRIASSPELAAKIRTYISLLLKWNRTVSLTAITDVDEIVRFHFGESLFALSVVPLHQGRLADVGSGAGFPGIPLAMGDSSLKVTLIESNTKKFTFLNEVIRELRLKNVVALNCRMEEVSSGDQLFDFITARALGQFEDLLHWSKRQLSSSGRVILWIGDQDAQRVSTESAWIWDYSVPVPGSERRLILSGSPRT